MTAADEPFHRIAALNAKFGFCENLAVSCDADRRAEPLREGPLSGSVIGIKSNIAVAGQAWTAGFGARADRVQDHDAPLVATLRGAGATVLSRLAMDEGALGAATNNPHFGRCDNPAAPGHSPGGSSGGSAAAVACGAADAALGTDTMGSVRIPAAYCGVWGLMLTPGMVDMQGIVPLAPDLDRLGILAAAPDRIASVLSTLTGARGHPHAPQGWLVADSMPDCAQPVAAFFARARAVLTDLLGPPDVADTPDLAALRSDTFRMTVVAALETLGDQPGRSAGLKKLLAHARSVSPEKRGAARASTAQAGSILRRALAPGAVLLLPTVAEPAFAHGQRPPIGQADFTALANVAGCPALAIPAPDATSPVSVQLVGAPGSELALLKLGEHLWQRLKIGKQSAPPI